MFDSHINEVPAWSRALMSPLHVNRYPPTQGAVTLPKGCKINLTLVPSVIKGAGIVWPALFRVSQAQSLIASPLPLERSF